jgi:Zn-dependent peptidase ImmA (M78 family)
LCNDFGIEVFWREFAEIDGILVRTPDSAYIGINTNRSFVRKRFTLAHELGHFLLHKGSHVDGSNPADNMLEREADMFASELLMPSKMVEETFTILKKFCPDRMILDEISWIFRISRLAMNIKLAELKLIPKI